jgi:hypothetical protein
VVQEAITAQLTEQIRLLEAMKVATEGSSAFKDYKPPVFTDGQSFQNRAEIALMMESMFAKAYTSAETVFGPTITIAGTAAVMSGKIVASMCEYGRDVGRMMGSMLEPNGLMDSAHRALAFKKIVWDGQVDSGTLTAYETTTAYNARVALGNDASTSEPNCSDDVEYVEGGSDDPPAEENEASDSPHPNQPVDQSAA